MLGSRSKSLLDRDDHRMGLAELTSQKKESWTHLCFGRKRSTQSTFEKWKDDIFPPLWMIIFTKKREETIYLCSR